VGPGKTGKVEQRRGEKGKRKRVGRNYKEDIYLKFSPAVQCTPLLIQTGNDLTASDTRA